VDGVFTMVGGFGGDAVNQGNLFVMLVDKNSENSPSKNSCGK